MTTEVDTKKRWWRFAVIRGEGIPAELDGRWFDLDAILSPLLPTGDFVTLEATNRWEQREDGAVAVVYEWTRRD